MKVITIVLIAFFSLLNIRCATSADVLGSSEEGLTKTFYSDFDTTWQAVRNALGKKYQIDSENREGGIIKTKWYDNTQERNFVDSFGADDTLKSARMKFTITIAKGFADGKNAVKVTVYKIQEAQRDFLEGWTPAESDGFDEKTLLYRVGRLITIKKKIDYINQKKAEDLKVN